MNVITKGIVKISDELIVSPGFSFEQFKKTKFYNGQDGIRIIYLDEMQVIDGRKYIVSLFFRADKIYMVSFMCCDKEFLECEEDKRKILHDEILMELGIKEQKEYNWGKISSGYDYKSNISSIDIVYF